MTSAIIAPAPTAAPNASSALPTDTAYAQVPRGDGPSGTSHDQDFFTWTREQAAALRAGCFQALDTNHLADEIEAMGRSEQRALASRLAIIIAHLLKLAIQVDRTPTNEKSWRSSIVTQRRQVQRLLQKNPGLKNPDILAEALESAWDDGRDLAIRETGMDPERFPDDNPYHLDELLRESL